MCTSEISIVVYEGEMKCSKKFLLQQMAPIQKRNTSLNDS